jgi:hypothetical protein
MLLDISLITQALTQLLKRNIELSPAWPTTTTLDASPLPPDLLKGANTLGVYLYHINEDPNLKNLPDWGSSQPPVRYLPLTLNLHYQLTAHSEVGEKFNTLREQLIMGLAMKTLHDYPKLDDTTVINGVRIFPVDLQHENNRFHILLQPIPPSEAVSYWTAGSQPLRLAAYYEVTVALLEPEELKSRAGRVLTYGVYSFVQGAPKLLTSLNIVTFQLPGETDTREITLQPAAVTYDKQVKFQGANLTAKETRLLLKSPKWSQALEVDSAWAVDPKPAEVNATVKKTLIQPLPLPAINILPGIYSAQIKVIDERVTSDGVMRHFEKLSNFTPFTITPWVKPLLLPDVSGVLDVEGAIFQAPELLPEYVEVYISDTRLLPGTYGSLNAGEFAVKNPTLLQIRLPAGLNPGDRLPFRLVINNAESEPQWIEVP